MSSFQRIVSPQCLARIGDGQVPSWAEWRRESISKQRSISALVLEPSLLLLLELPGAVIQEPLRSAARKWGCSLVFPLLVESLLPAAKSFSICHSASKFQNFLLVSFSLCPHRLMCLHFILKILLLSF